jgi:hypothetical protein
MKTALLLIITLIVLIWFPWFVATVIYASFLEWNLHKHLMHTKRKWFPYPFNTHAVTHHQIFKADETYHLQHEDDKHTIPMAWWNGIVLVTIATIPTIFIGYFRSDILIPIQTFVVVGLYYCTYEYFHWCMHLPKERWFEITRWYKNLKERHRLHHLKMSTTNFNVVLPVADFWYGTYEAPSIA